MKEIKLQCFVLSEEQQEPFELHVFFDASGKAYAACVYVVSTNSRRERISNLLEAKCKVSQLKTQPIPRLELCAVLFGSCLLSSVKPLSECLSIYMQQRAGAIPQLFSAGFLKNQVTGHLLLRTKLPKYTTMTVLTSNTYPQKKIQLMQRLVVLSQMYSRTWKFGGRDLVGYAVEYYYHKRN